MSTRHDEYRTFAAEEYAAVDEPYYEPVGDEEQLFRAAFEQRVPVLLKGPTGCGKTRFVEYMAYQLGRPLSVLREHDHTGESLSPSGLPVVTVACHEDLTASDLVGRYLLEGEGTRWLDGPLTRAVKSGAICYLDEVVEARKDTTVLIHPLTLSANGYGKRTALDQYPKKGRGTGGVIGFKVTTKTGPVAAVRVVDSTRELMLISEEGIVLRTSVESIRQTGRSAEGVSVMKLAPSDRVASIAVIEEQPVIIGGDGADEKPKRGARNGATASADGATTGTQARGKTPPAGKPGENGHKPGTNGRSG